MISDAYADASIDCEESGTTRGVHNRNAALGCTDATGNEKGHWLVLIG